MNLRSHKNNTLSASMSSTAQQPNQRHSWPEARLSRRCRPHCKAQQRSLVRLEQFAGVARVRPNPSLNHRTCYGKQRKPGPRQMVHHREPGLRRSPPQAG